MPKNKVVKYALITLGLIVLYVNRAIFNPVKLPLNADAGAKGEDANVADPENAKSDNQTAIDRALLKIKTGSVKVNPTSKEASQSL